MQNTFTIEEIRKYILLQDSLGDVLYNLKEENIIDANKPEEDDNDDEYEESEYIYLLEHNKFLND